MIRVRKKTIDKATESLVGQASKAGTPLVFERYEDQVPACGFGRMGLDCKACTQGPCRVNPFEETSSTTCGRDRDGTVAASFLRLVSDGAVAIAAHAGAESDVAPAVFSAITAANEGADAEALLRKAVEVATAGYDALGSPAASTVSDIPVGFGVLDPTRLNIVLIGSIPAGRVREIAAELSKHPDVKVVAAAGAEVTGLPVPGNYNSEETLLLTNAVDGIVAGKSCVAPGFVALAARQNVSIMNPAEFDAAKLLAAAKAHFRINAGRSLGERYVPASATVGFSPEAFSAVSPAGWKKLARAGVQGVAILGGCNNAAETQDGAIVRQTLEFLKNDVLVVASGCASTALARAGFMDPARVGEFTGKRLQAFLAELSAATGIAVPAVLGAGTCWAMPTAVETARLLGKQLKVYVGLSMPEVSRPASWSTALAVAAKGIPTYVGPILPLDGGLGTVSTLNSLLAAKGGSLQGPGQVGDPEAVLKLVVRAAC